MDIYKNLDFSDLLEKNGLEKDRRFLEILKQKCQLKKVENNTYKISEQEKTYEINKVE